MRMEHLPETGCARRGMFLPRLTGPYSLLASSPPVWSACGLPPLSSPAARRDSVTPAAPGLRLRTDRKARRPAKGRTSDFPLLSDRESEKSGGKPHALQRGRGETEWLGRKSPAERA